MFSALRRRITPATAIATLALVFAMTGGAYAANHFLITSTKQISPKVLKALKGAAGAKGANGANGAAGAAGPQGPAGPGGGQGPQGPQGPKGEAGPKGESGPKGENGKNGTTGFTETLPSGKTETGTWAFNATAKGEVIVPLSFSIPLDTEIEAGHTHYVTREEWTNKTAPADCPGTVDAPKAEPGSLCIYETVLFNAAFVLTDNPTGFQPGASSSGSLVRFNVESEEPLRKGFGTWAVTAE